MFRGDFEECAKIAFVIKQYGQIKLPKKRKNAVVPYNKDLSDRAIWRRMKKVVVKKELRIIKNCQMELSRTPSVDLLLMKKAAIAALNQCKNCKGPDERNLYCGASKVIDSFDINF